MNMKNFIYVLLSVLIIGIIFIGCNQNNELQISKEVKMYVADGDKNPIFKTKIALYKNGNANISNLLSSYIYYDGEIKYTLRGGILTLTTDEQVATFEVSNNGDTLTVLSSSFIFVNVEGIYNYYDNTDEN